ncbi:unnamed protein product [Danaus chrysippus]|uniref:(African queen) hypothetical protein n=1 Tax=Danaus chrysippus TaxID=151541 RepID=A0A8J2VPL9_9NEOP|nr:unnamed protein product [Danaus chrysippus]
MAPRETPKAAHKVQRVISKATKSKASPIATLKKTMTSKSCTEKMLKANNLAEPRARTSTVPKVSTPKPKENRAAPMPSTTSKSAKKSAWKKRPKPAHSGVPVPEKMKRLLEKQLQDADCSL